MGQSHLQHPLSEEQRTLYARHLLLPEIGKEGQAALCAATVHAPAGADPEAARVAREYLERAGVRWSDADGLEVPVPTAEEARRLGEPAAVVAGAFAAVEAIKRIVGVGRPGAFPEDLEP